MGAATPAKAELQQLKGQGYSCAEAKAAGFTEAEAVQAGYALAEVIQGFGTHTLVLKASRHAARHATSHAAHHAQPLPPAAPPHQAPLVDARASLPCVSPPRSVTTALRDRACVRSPTSSRTRWARKV